MTRCERCVRTAYVPGERFRLLSQQTVFEALRSYRNIAGIDCVLGRTLDGKFETAARIVDVVRL
jgi:hypothetical protein